MSSSPLTDLSPRLHHLLVAESAVQQRAHVATWVGQELARRSKVIYIRRPLVPGSHWAFGAAGRPRIAAAIADGQLTVHEIDDVGGRHAHSTGQLSVLISGICERATRQGWPTIAVTRETPLRLMAGDAEATQLAAEERVLDELSVRWPLRTVCQLTLAEENDAAIAESVAIHHRSLYDGAWSTSTDGVWWQLHGVLDSRVARRFGSALLGALRTSRLKLDDRTLYIDMSTVHSMDFACTRILLLAGRSAGRHQRIVVRGATSFLRELVATTIHPRRVLFDDELDGGHLRLG